MVLPIWQIWLPGWWKLSWLTWMIFLADLVARTLYSYSARMVERLVADITASRGRAVYTGKGGDETDKFLQQLGAMAGQYRAPR